MKVVNEFIDAFPFECAPRKISRREDLLFAAPLPLKIRPIREFPPIEVVHYPTQYEDKPFSPPVGVYESADFRVEWQDMEGRQPFYHRNCGVDEISFQVSGERTLITELGTVELRPGDFSRIPDGVAHDNYGRQDIHLLFYMPGPVQELTDSTRTSSYLAVPFEGWSPAVINELVTEKVGGLGNDLLIAPVDEALLIQSAQKTEDRIQIPALPENGLRWIYRGAEVVFGYCSLASSRGEQYTRHRDAVEIQYQIRGDRTLVTQRGTVRLGPGDFVQIPKGVAFTSIHADCCEYLCLATRQTIPLAAKPIRQGEFLDYQDIDALRQF